MARTVKRSVSISGHRTSISLEDAFWTALGDIARDAGTSVAGVVKEIDHTRGDAGLSAAIRVYVLNHYRNRAGRSPTED